MSATLLGTNRVSEAEISMVPDVPWTPTWSPVHHRDVIRAVKNGIESVGLDIMKAEYVLAAQGQKMFCVYDLSHFDTELCWSIGVRNSMNKSMALGITAGTRVFVCENLCFSGEYVSIRRHTSGLDNDELASIAYRTMQMMIPRLQAFQAWHTSLKKYQLSATDLMVLLVEIIDKRVFPASKFHQFRSLCNDVYDDTLWGFHEACTEVLKDTSPLNLPKKNKVLNNVIDNYLASRDDFPSGLGNFYEQRAQYRSR